VKNRLTTFLLICVFSGSTGAAAAKGGKDDHLWLPGIALMTTIGGQSTDSSVESNIRPTDDPGIRIQESQALLFPSIGFSLELMSPVVIDLPGKPRAFVHADLLPILTTDRKLAFEGAPGPFGFPDAVSYPEEAIEGQGSRTSMDLASLAYGFGAGIAFSFDWMGYEFKLKPSVEYYRSSGTFRGIVSRAFRPSNAVPIDRLVQLTFRERRTWDAVGGGVELEVKAIQTGRIEGVIFVTGKGFSSIGDRSISGTVANPATPVDDMARFRYKAAPTLYSFGVGFRLRWKAL
jgi:hypothetical protein